MKVMASDRAEKEDVAEFCPNNASEVESFDLVIQRGAA
jgi:hypothetical protein